MRNVVLAAAAGLALALTAGSAFAVPDTAEILNHGYGADQGAVGAYARTDIVKWAPFQGGASDENPAWRNGVDTGHVHH